MPGLGTGFSLTLSPLEMTRNKVATVPEFWVAKAKLQGKEGSLLCGHGSDTEAGSWEKNGIHYTYAGCVGLDIKKTLRLFLNMRKCWRNVWEMSKHEEVMSSYLHLYPWHFLKQIDHKAAVLCANNSPPFQIILHFQSLVFYFCALTQAKRRETCCKDFGDRVSCAVTTKIFLPGGLSKIKNLTQKLDLVTFRSKSNVTSMLLSIRIY